MEHKFTTANFAVEVLDSDMPVLVDFYAQWCGPCKMMGPVVKEMADIFDGKMKIGKLDIDESMDIAQKYRVMSVPSFLVFKDGQVAGTFVGGMSQKDLEEKVESVM